MARVVLAFLMLSAAAVAIVNGQGAWKNGRATFYGLDGWSIHQGACGFGYQWPDIYPGFDVVAISDASSEFGGSCGRCYEVKCRNADFTDGYGKPIERSSACYDESKSVVVRAVDACPCNYPGNAYSNSRWCCGDGGAGEAHMDLSIWAFEKLASTSIGVMGLSYREVPCSYAPSNVATTDYPSPPEPPEKFGAKRPEEVQYVQRFDGSGMTQGSVTTISKDEKPWGPIVPPEKVYKDGTLDGEKSSSGSYETEDSTDSGCTDKAPTDGSTCQQQKDWGKCGENWLIAGKFCRSTCGRCSSGESSSDTSSSSSSLETSDGGCVDIAPTDGSTCQQQKDWGKCGENWLISGNFCRLTCGRCSGSSSSDATSDSSSSDSSTSSSSDCTDTAPNDGFSCQEHKDWGNCNESWLKADGFCRVTCGLCEVQSFEG